MSNLKDAYMSLLDVSKQEMINSKERYERAIQRYLVYEMPDSDVLEFIGDRFMLTVILIIADRRKNYLVATSGRDGFEMNISLKELEDMLKEISGDHYSLIESKINELLSVFEDHISSGIDVDMYNTDFHLKESHRISLIGIEESYYDDYDYEDEYLVKGIYREFYSRLYDLCKKRIVDIVNRILDGTYSYIYDNAVFDLYRYPDRQREQISQKIESEMSSIDNKGVKKEIIDIYLEFINE